MRLSAEFMPPDCLTFEHVLNPYPSCVIAEKGLLLGNLPYVVTEDPVECIAHSLLVSHQSVASAELVVGGKLDPTVVLVVEEVSSGGGDDLEESVCRSLDASVEELAGVGVRVVREEVCDLPCISSCPGNSISDNLVQIRSDRWPKFANVPSFDAELARLI